MWTIIDHRKLVVRILWRGIRTVASEAKAEGKWTLYSITVSLTLGNTFPSTVNLNYSISI